MKTYIGTKMLKAEPMTREEYNHYRGWSMPPDEDGTDEGYLVEYLDGGESNHPEHAGYISWSPADVFERTYHVVPNAEGIEDLIPRDQRVVAEHAQLLGRFEKLQVFMKNRLFKTLPLLVRQNLRQQSRAMRAYLNALEWRIARH